MTPVPLDGSWGRPSRWNRAAKVLISAFCLQTVCVESLTSVGAEEFPTVQPRPRTVSANSAKIGDFSDEWPALQHGVVVESTQQDLSVPIAAAETVQDIAVARILVQKLHQDSNVESGAYPMNDNMEPSPNRRVLPETSDAPKTLQQTKTTSTSRDDAADLHTEKPGELLQTSSSVIETSSSRTTTEDSLVTGAIASPQSSPDVEPVVNDGPRTDQERSSTMPSSDEKTTSSSAIGRDLFGTTEKDAESNAIDFSDGPKVSLVQGELVGVSITVANDRSIDAFFGVQYAENPSRFARAEEIKAWKGLKLALNASEPCPRRDPEITTESCLYLNVLRPRDGEDLPVLVWFLGDGMNGEEDSVRMDFSALSAEEEILIITVTFRVGVFGFLNASIDDVQGDIGLHDQALALKFIHENAEAFGGKPAAITIAGFGFSGAIAGMHLLDGETSEWFQGIIFLSGCPLMLNPRTFKNAFPQFLEHVQCVEETIADSLQCLEGKQLAELVSGLNFGPTSKTGLKLRDCFAKTDVRGRRILLGSYAYSGWKDDSDIREFFASRESDHGRLVLLKEAVELRFDLPMASVENRNVFRAYAPSAPANLQGDNARPEILKLIGEMTQDFLHRCPSEMLARSTGSGNEVFVFELDYQEKPPNELRYLLDLTSDHGQSRKSSDLSRNVRKEIVAFIRGG